MRLVRKTAQLPRGRLHPIVRRAVPALLIAGVVLGLAWSGKFQRSTEVYTLVAAVLVLFMAKYAYTGLWFGLERVGVRNARGRWQARSPFLQRAVPPVGISGVVILAAWAAGLAPDLSLIVLLLITYALYLLPSRLRHFAVPATVLALVVAYPFFIQQTNYQRFLFNLPIFNTFPSMDTMVSMIIFAMMAIGLNMVVGYAGLLDLGYVAFYAIGAYTAAWLASPHFAAYGIHFDVGSVAEKPILQVGGIHLTIWLVLIAAGILTAFVGVVIGLRDSRLGRAWIAIREDETAAAAMGIPLMRTKTWAYASGAFFGGIAGAWFATIKTGVFPDDFFFNISVLILSMVILGGMGNVWGVIAGAAFLEYLNLEGIANFNGWMNDHVLVCDPTKQNPSSVISGGCLNAPLVTFGIYGAIIVLVMLLRPQGLFPERRRELEFETGVHDTPFQDESA